MNNQRWIIVLGAVVSIAAIAVFLVMQQASSPEKTVEKFYHAIEKKDHEELKTLLVADEEKAKMNKVSLQALINYLNQNNASFEAIKDGFEDQISNEDYSTSTQQISLIEDEKKWGVFSQYKLKAKTVAIKVKDEQENDNINKLSAGGMTIPVQNKEEGVYGPVLPGVYELETTVSNQLGVFKEKAKKDLWGNTEISLFIDDVKLVKEDKKVQQEILEAIAVFNSDFAVFQTSSFNMEKFTNVTDTIKEINSFAKADFERAKDYIDEVQSQYLGSVVNTDGLTVHYFNEQWKADAQALVSYSNKLKLREQTAYEDFSDETIWNYSLIYDNDKKKWLIANVVDTRKGKADTQFWNSKKEMKVSNPEVHKWMRTGQKDQAIF
ncbi:hypothetical protein JOC78_000745 [Bacillus ectoiniformans]|uniref:TcaA second domain-containing protein n=1 Tax=Bacillus ectoiniformans TaxID=1494429 RepID=UPI001957F7D0|nr:hypothetical protein [Bacillus ectoiniformans]MBM7647805.1 hypothetical protein [Bacillus ectoiniformans]